MPWKDIEKQRAAIRRHYYANRQVYIDKAVVRKKKLCQWIGAIKESVPCKDCNKHYPYYVMDFDHTGIKQKISRGLLIAVAVLSCSKLKWLNVKSSVQTAIECVPTSG